MLLSGASFCLIGLLGLGLGAIIWHTAAGVAVMAGGVTEFTDAVTRVAAGGTALDREILTRTLQPMTCRLHVCARPPSGPLTPARPPVNYQAPVLARTPSHSCPALSAVSWPRGDGWIQSG